MNMSPTLTGAVAVSTGMIASIVSWLAAILHLSMPPEGAGAIAAVILWGAHVISAEIAHARAEPTKPADAPK